ncbi:alanine racemase [Clostridium carnis]
MNLLHPVWVEINLNNFIYNLNQIKSHTVNSEIIGVVKANAYGHGAVEISKVLLENGIEKLAVANVLEGIELRQNKIDCPLMILGISEDIAIDSIINYSMEPTVSSYEFAYNLNKRAKELNKIINIHIALDTGMGRIGFRKTKESIDEITKISNLENLKIVSGFSHFAKADSNDKEYCYKQLENYDYFINELNNKNVCLGNKNFCNSAGIIDLPLNHYNNVRPGIILYGYYPSDEVRKEVIDLKPVLTWKTKVLYIKEIDKDEFIGYGNSFKSTRKTKIATIPVGYADGYSRGLSNKGKVIINGQLAPIVGNVCMDQCMVDITDLDNINLGDEVILLGNDKKVKFDGDDMAKLLGTINYELFCLIGRRVPRVYLKDNLVTLVAHQF